jgi:hypothetical protein
MISEFDKWSAAFCAWREARGETATLHDSLRGVLHVIVNRAAERGLSWTQVVYQYLQFSSITALGDPQIKAGTVPLDGDEIGKQFRFLFRRDFPGSNDPMSFGDFE